MKHVSFSSLEVFQHCPFQYKLREVDKVPIERGNLYSAFGNGVHDTLQKIIPDSSVNIYDTFQYCFKRRLKKLPYSRKLEIFQDPELKAIATEMMVDGPRLCREGLKILNEKFPGYELFGVEQKFSDPITNYPNDQYEFFGTIDLIIFWKGKYHVLDWKTSLKGWNPEKKTDPLVLSQLVFYKHFFSLLTDTPPDDVSAHFALLKREMPVGEKVEIFEVPVNENKTQDALKVLNNMLYNIDRGNFPKKKTSCRFCDYHETIYCDAK